jgi:hypothetical protein
MKGENMSEKEKNLGVRVGDTIIHCNRSFTIVNIQCEEQVEGMVLAVRAYDPDMASKIHQKTIVAEQTGNQVMDMIRKITEGGPGNMGFNIGG